MTMNLSPKQRTTTRKLAAVLQPSAVLDLKWGQVASINLAASTLTVKLMGASTTNTVKFNGTYSPTVGDTVACLYKNRDLFVIGAMAPQGMSAMKATTVTPSGAISSAETVLVTLPLQAGASLEVGSIIRVTLQGTCTSTVANASTLTLRAGALGTTGDASVAAPIVTAAASGTAVPFKIVLELVVQTLGATGTVSGSMTVLNSGTTGIAAQPVTVVPFTSTTFATTTATKLSITYKSAASTTTTTFQTASIQVTP